MSELAINGGKPLFDKILTKPFPIGKEEHDAVIKVLKKGILSRAGRGEYVQIFEKKFAFFLNVNYAVSTSSGTTALHTAVAALDIKKGDEVIVPSLTFISTASVVVQQGGTPIFADINSDTFNIDYKDIERKITPKTKAVIVVHIYGIPADMDKIVKICKKRKLKLIEDCAQAHGAIYNNRNVGTIGDFGCFSFYQTKNMTTGEGGMVITNNKELFNKCKSIVDHGLENNDLQSYNYDRLGFNYHLTEVQAAIGDVQLAKLKKNNMKRHENAMLYKKLLSDTPLVFQKENIKGVSAFYCLTALLPKQLSKKTEFFINAIRSENVEINRLYPVPLHLTKLFYDEKADCPVTEDVTSRLLNFYTNPGISKKYIIRTCQAVKKVFSHYKYE
jgi:dTDP-4-amino-4,6-dideoxygalactose transaminase